MRSGGSSTERTLGVSACGIRYENGADWYLIANRGRGIQQAADLRIGVWSLGASRSVDLTEAGRRYFERCGRLVEEARLAQEALRDAAEPPSGHLRLSMWRSGSAR